MNNLSLKLGNILFKYCYPFYKPLYFQYKKVSDASKIKTISDHLKSEMRVLDIGANIGFYTELLSKRVGDSGQVFAFEPEALNYERLQKNISNLKNVKIYQKAVGCENSKLKLFFSDELNVDHQTYDSGEGRKYYEVDSVRLDDFLHNQKIDFIKIDVQGFDYFALKGCENIIKNSENIVIFGEFWPYGLKKSGLEKPFKYIEYLESLGLNVQIFGHKDKRDFNQESEDKFFYTDFLAVK